MSTASFDDSSNLVDIPQPESNGNNDGAGVATDTKQTNLLDDPIDLPEAKAVESKPKSKKSKARKLLKRAKSPISGAINKTTKEFKKLSNLPKHHHSIPKSPSKSPSKENLTDEYGHLEEKLGEKKSEEWLAFQQMQDRIKQTVLKTQNSLNKYTSQSEDDEPKSGKSGWTDFDDSTALDPEEIIDTTLAPVINISCANVNSNVSEQQNLIDISPDKSHLTTTSRSSPPISPGPPVNSRISSMENLNQEQSKETAAVPKVEEEIDLLGLGSSQAPPATSTTNSAAMLTDDLLGLDSFLTPTPATTDTASDGLLAPMQGTVDSAPDDILAPVQTTTVSAGDDILAPSPATTNSAGDDFIVPTPATTNITGDDFMVPTPATTNIAGDDFIAPTPATTHIAYGDFIAPTPAITNSAGDDFIAPTPATTQIAGDDFMAPTPATTHIAGDDFMTPTPATTTIAGDDFLAPLPATTESTNNAASQPSDTQVLSGYTFTSSISGDLVTSTTAPETITAKTDDTFFDQTENKQNVVESGNQVEPVNTKVQSVDVPEATPPMSANTDTSKAAENKFAAMLGEPLNPLTPAPAPITVSKPEPEPTTQQASNTTVHDDFSSFDPMKADTINANLPSVASLYNPFQASSNPVTIMSDNQGGVSNVNMFGTSPQSYGSMPAGSGSIDLLSKIKMMSSGSQPVSPARKTAQKTQKDVFGFVKKELKKKDSENVNDDDDDDDDAYKTLADIGKPKVEPQTVDIQPEEPSLSTDTVEPDVSNTANNPFLTGDFVDTDVSANQGITENAAAMFGLDEDTNKTADADFDFDKAWETDIGDTKRKQWTDMDAMDATGNMFDESDFEKAGSKATSEGDSAWATKESDSNLGAAWGSEAGLTSESANPFQDDFSKLDDVPVDKATNANPFLLDNIGTDASTVDSSSVINPFLDFGGDQPAPNEQPVDLLGSRPVVLSDSENFFTDSVSDAKPDTAVTDDIFDPFKVTSKPAAASDDALDLFVSAPVEEEKPHPKPSHDDDHGFKLEIKPVADSGKADTVSPTPLLKPPPKPPKSPQPPRENPFDRDSPPEENFAQFEIKDVERPKEPPTKSISTDSTTTEEEEIVEPLEPYLPKSDKEGFKLMLRYPTKKKIAGNRYWKNVFVKIVRQSEGLVIKVFNDAKDSSPLQELPLQPCYSLSDVALQQYDQYGKIHTVKLQYVFYKERVGIKTDRITPSIVKFKKREKPKATMILDHSPQVSELLKFGSLDKNEIVDFIREVEDTFMNLEAHREKTLTYAKDEVTAEVHDEYTAELNKFGKVIMQKARVRIFVLAFLTGMPTVEVGLNDKRRRGKEVVGRNDIIPIKTEEWIKLEDVEFHCSVDKDDFEKTNNIKFHPLDACQFELLRYRVRPRENKELPMQLTIQQIFKHRKCEIRCDLLVTGYHSYSKKHGQFPCEDIEVRFPIPETWIYMFRYERRFGYGSIHSATRKPGKIKGLERLTMMAQGHFNQTLMEADVGTAKYEHVYRSVVWRIPRLPVRNQGAYTSHLMKLRLELGPHDEVPETFEDYAYAEFSMPCSTVSQSQIRSIAVTNPNPPEKWVRSMAHYRYRVEIEHLDEYPEMMAIGTVYKEATMVSPTKSEEEENKEPEERDPRLAVSDTDSSDSD